MRWDVQENEMGLGARGPWAKRRARGVVALSRVFVTSPMQLLGMTRVSWTPAPAAAAVTEPEEAPAPAVAAARGEEKYDGEEPEVLEDV